MKVDARARFQEGVDCAGGLPVSRCCCHSCDQLLLKARPVCAPGLQFPFQGFSYVPAKVSTQPCRNIGKYLQLSSNCWRHAMTACANRGLVLPRMWHGVQSCEWHGTRGVARRPWTLAGRETQTRCPGSCLQQTTAPPSTRLHSTMHHLWCPPRFPSTSSPQRLHVVAGTSPSRKTSRGKGQQHRSEDSRAELDLRCHPRRRGLQIHLQRL